MLNIAGAVGEWLLVKTVAVIPQLGQSGSSHCRWPMLGPLQTFPSPPGVLLVSSCLKFSFVFFMSFYGRREPSLEALRPSFSPCPSLFRFTYSMLFYLPLTTHWLAHTSPRCLPFSFIPCHTACPFIPWPIHYFSRSLVACWPWEYLPITCIAYTCEKQLYRDMQMGLQIVQSCISLGNGVE